MTLSEALSIVFAAIAPGVDLEPDEDPFEVAARCVANNYTPEALAEECGLAWPMRPEMLDMAAAAGMARWATIQRDQAIKSAVDAGCPLRAAGEATGLSHTAIAKIAARP